MRSYPCPVCQLCGAAGQSVYHDLTDRLFSAPGQWNITKCPNPKCGQLWPDPMPAPEDISQAYLSYYTHVMPQTKPDPTLRSRAIQAIRRGYLARRYGYAFAEATGASAQTLGLLAYLNPFRRAWLDFSMMYLPGHPAGRLLEIGCGSGAMLKGFEDLGWKTEGIDFDPAAVDACHRRGLRVNLGTLEARHYPSNSFDAVILSHVIEHVHDPVALLTECRRILKSGGTLSLVTPHVNALGHRVFAQSWFCLDPPRHLHLFSIPALRGALYRAGFEDARIFSSLRDASETFIASDSIRRTGRFRMGSRHSALQEACGAALQTIEWIQLKLGFEVGEELVALAKKSEAD
jgi:SAM-dependent methyltransferase